MENPKIIEQIIQGINYYLETLAKPSHMEKYTDKMCSWIKPKAEFEHGPCGVYNINFGHKTNEQLRQLIQGYLDKGAPNCWFVTPLSKPDNLCNVLSAMDQYVLDDFGMAIPPENIEHIRSSLMNTIPEYKVIRVDNKNDFKKWASIVNTALFEEPLCDPEQYYPLCKDGIIKCFLGYVNNKSVSTSMTLMTDNGVGKIEWVSTLPDFRRKGIGKALCCAGIEQLLNDGVSIITLTAREMGVSLYKSLGFKVYY
jgi:GNAT superfamily N-acetyltransferase